MATESDAPIGPYGLRYGEGDAYWFLDFLTTFKATTGTTGGGFALLEQRAAKGAGSPLHVYRREAESFYVLDGELTIWAGGQLIEAPAGSFVYRPPNVPHTFTVASDEGRFLLLTQPAGFDAFLRAFGQPASATLSPPASEPPDVERLTALAAEHGIEILGPPGYPRLFLSQLITPGGQDVDGWPAARTLAGVPRPQLPGYGKAASIIRATKPQNFHP